MKDNRNDNTNRRTNYTQEEERLGMGRRKEDRKGEEHKTEKEKNNKRIRKTWVMGRREAMERAGNRYAT